jgi:hypothetical protein
MMYAEPIKAKRSQIEVQIIFHNVIVYVSHSYVFSEQFRVLEVTVF